MQIKNIDIGQIRIPHKHRRIGSEDGTILASMKLEGLKDPIIVVAGRNEYILADGSRRLRAARKLKWKKIKVSVRKPPQGMNPEAYAGLLRLTVNHHRQGFYPSQRAHYLKILNQKYGVPINEIAEACGVSTHAAKTWMAVSDCSDEIQMFIDDGKFPVDSGRMINTLKPQGHILIADHFRDRPKITLGELKTFVKRIHARHPEHIRVSLKPRIKRTSRRRDQRAYGRYSDLGLAELEDKVNELEKEITFMRREIFRATPIIKAICKNGKLRLALQGDSLRKFESFLAETGHG